MDGQRTPEKGEWRRPYFARPGFWRGAQSGSDEKILRVWEEATISRRWSGRRTPSLPPRSPPAVLTRQDEIP